MVTSGLSPPFPRTPWRYQDDSCDVASMNSPKCSTLAKENTLLKVKRRIQWEDKAESLFSLPFRSCVTAMKLEDKQGLSLGM